MLMDHQSELAERARENRAAWDRYAAAFIAGQAACHEHAVSAEDVAARAAEYASAMLKLRQQKFS